MALPGVLIRPVIFSSADTESSRYRCSTHSTTIRLNQLGWKQPINRALGARLDVCFCRLGLQSRCLGLQDLGLGLCPLLCGHASFFRLLQPSLYLGVELIDLFLELCFP